MERKAEVPETVVHATSETRKPIAADSKVKSTGQAARQQKPNNGADSQSHCEEFGGQLNQQSNETCEKQKFEEIMHGEIPKVFAENNYHLLLKQ